MRKKSTEQGDRVITHVADPLAPALVGEHGAEHARAVLEVLVEGGLHATRFRSSSFRALAPPIHFHGRGLQVVGRQLSLPREVRGAARWWRCSRGRSRRPATTTAAPRPRRPWSSPPSQRAAAAVPPALPTHSGHRRIPCSPALWSPWCACDWRSPQPAPMAGDRGRLCLPRRPWPAVAH